MHSSVGTDFGVTHMIRVKQAEWFVTRDFKRGVGPHEEGHYHRWSVLQCDKCHGMKCFCVSCQDRIMCFYLRRSPLLCFESLIVPIITVLFKTKFTKCLAVKANKRHRKMTEAKKSLTCLFCFIYVQEAELCVVFFFNVSFSPTRFLSLQLVLKAPLSLPRAQDCVSSVRLTVAPPSRLPPSVVVGTAITAEIWTNLRMCAPVSQSLPLC